MSSLSQREQEMVGSSPDLTAWYVFPPPRGRKESGLYNHAHDKRLKMKNYLRNFLELMVNQPAEEASVRKDDETIGAYSEEEWALISGYDITTVRKYIAQIADILFKAGVKPRQEFFQFVTDGDWEGVRIGCPVIFLSPKVAVKTRKRRRRRRKPRPRKPHPR